MKYVSLFTILLALGTAAPAFAGSIFDKIADDSDFGNGGSEIKKFDKDLDRKEIEANAKKDLEKEYWENCGPWKVTTSRRETINVLDKLQARTAGFTKEKKSKIADKLSKLYDKEKIVAALSATSNSEIDCSLVWFNVYGADGTMIELRYNMGD